MKKKRNYNTRITLRDIANDTGYSITAVSHALNGRSDISEATKKKIRESAHRLGYIGNRTAASLQSGMTRTIAVIVGDMANPHFAFMSKIIETLLRENNYSSFFMNTHEDEQIESECLRLAAKQNVDGLIWCPVQISGSLRNLHFVESLQIPFVLIGRHFPNASTSYVRIDDYKAGYLVGRHLIEKGRHNTTYVNTPMQNSSSAERLSGFLASYDEASIPLNNNTVYFNEDGSYFRLLLTPAGEWASDAIICFNDLIAWDVMTRGASQKQKPSSKLSILAFDNLHSFLPLPFSLTSVSASKVSMPRRAVEILLKQIETPNIPLSRLTLDVELIDRGSVK